MVRIPPKYFWPGLVIGFLSMTVLFNVGIIVAANSGNGPQPVEDYYAQAVNYDEMKDLERASDTLGLVWQATFVESADGTSRLELVVVDRNRQPVEALDATYELRSPSLTKAVATGSLTPATGAGAYALEDAAVRRAGLWDVVIDGEYNGVAFRKTMRVER